MAPDLGLTVEWPQAGQRLWTELVSWRWLLLGSWYHRKDFKETQLEFAHPFTWMQRRRIRLLSWQKGSSISVQIEDGRWQCMSRYWPYFLPRIIMPWEVIVVLMWKLWKINHCRLSNSWQRKPRWNHWHCGKGQWRPSFSVVRIGKSFLFAEFRMSKNKPWETWLISSVRTRIDWWKNFNTKIRPRQVLLSASKDTADHLRNPSRSYHCQRMVWYCLACSRTTTAVANVEIASRRSRQPRKCSLWNDFSFTRIAMFLQFQTDLSNFVSQRRRKPILSLFTSAAIVSVKRSIETKIC